MDKQFVADQLSTAGLIACIPTTLPLQDTFSLIDSLLASPVFAVAVVGQTLADCEPLVADFRQRGGDNFVVGSLVQERPELLPLTAAQFIIGERPPLIAPESLFVPAVYTFEQAKECSRYPVMAVMTDDLNLYKRIVSLNCARSSIPFGSISSTAVPEWQEAGAKSVGAPLWFSDEQLMSETITLARRYNAHFHGVR